MSILKAILLGFVQGVTEFLPISSSGHLSVFQHFLNVSNDTSLLFSVLLHLGTLVAVFIAYYKTIFELIKEFGLLIKDIFTGKFNWKERSETRNMLFMFVISCVPLLFLLIPVGNDRNLMDILGSLAEDNDIFVEGICLIFTAILLLAGTYRAKNISQPKSQMGPVEAFIVGIAQMLAAGFPGISRSGSTISTGMICGLKKEYMVRYSFILGIPAILAANVLEIKDAVSEGAQVEILPVILGVVTAAVVGFLAIKILEWLVKTDKFKFFAYYCFAAGAAVIIAAAIEKFAA